ncbi:MULTISPECIES: SMP-30/gluconolactonase/LRE family protein [Halorussus]|uniref:SMP-30/gluconolactonase/LRE family protein n=1 Tax=Halorussus TaxID=1070314 RepID=UPI000E210254|nr:MULTISPECIES: SMP-30/gluconolactonase/LRE family protein [Halorussus]NHN60801.1 SMP-30/gluconolactonase/LRE family protein [Halorussus sp. JP-T4]
MVIRFLRDHPVLSGGLLVGAAFGVGSAIDSRLDPAAWRPPDPPDLRGALAQNRALTGSETVVTCEGPEDVAFDDEGRLYTGVADGTVRRTVDPVDADATDAALEVFARTGGRPLALEFDGDDLLVCAEDAGLVSVGPDGDVETLATRAGGRSIAYADDLHVADDGTVYFSDATVHDQYQDELFELRDTGRLLAYHPDEGETTVELDGLGFANGVAPGPDGDSLLVTETSRYRVTRYWHRGDREGESEYFAENLPGFPDNVDAAGDGSYWVAIPALRDETIDRIHRHPWVVRQLGKLPESVLGQVAGEPYGLVLRLDADGDVVESLHDPTGGVFGVTSATPRDGALYLGTLFGNRVVRYPTE